VLIKYFRILTYIFIYIRRIFYLFSNTKNIYNLFLNIIFFRNIICNRFLSKFLSPRELPLSLYIVTSLITINFEVTSLFFKHKLTRHEFVLGAVGCTKMWRFLYLMAWSQSLIGSHGKRWAHEMLVVFNPKTSDALGGR